jgi:hypothetical protein
LPRTIRDLNSLHVFALLVFAPDGRPTRVSRPGCYRKPSHLAPQSRRGVLTSIKQP